MPRHYHHPNAQAYDRHGHNDFHLNPVSQAHASRSSFASYAGSEAYKPLVHNHGASKLVAADQRLKTRIRVLKFVSRVTALLLSLVTLVPISMTLVKFLLTRNTYFTVDGKERTAWAQDTITWYTYMYFGVSLLSFIFNLVVVIAYCCGVDKANMAASLSSWWTTSVMIGHVLVWIVSAALYRFGKEPVLGKFRDLWGWTCSPAAQAIQKDIPNVDYDQYCTIQSASFYAGIINVATGVLTATIFILAVLRSRSKKRSQKIQASAEPLRF